MPGRNRDLWLIVAAVGLSGGGDWIALTALILWVADTMDSALAVSALFAAVWGPVVLLAGPAGSLVDRAENVRLMGIVSLGQAAVAVGLALALGADSFGLVLALALLLGMGTAVTQPAEFALVPAIAGESDLVRANGYVETARYAGIALGPLAGGALAGALGTEAALLADAATFAFVAVAAGLMRTRRRVAPAADDDPSLARSRAGFVFLWRDRLLAVVMAVTVASLMLFSISIAADVFFITEDLGASDVAFGVAYTTWTVGMAAGASFLARRFGSGALAVGAMAMIVIQGIGIVAGPVSMLYSVTVIGFVIGGIAHGTKNVLVRTLIHERTPDRIRGRTFAAYNALRNGAEIAALALAGGLVAALGARDALYIAGIGPAVIGLIGLVAYARLTSELQPSAERAG